MLFLFLDKCSKTVQNQRRADRFGNPVRRGNPNGGAPGPSHYRQWLVVYVLQALLCCRVAVCKAQRGKFREKLIVFVARKMYLDLGVKLSSQFNLLVFYSVCLYFSTFFDLGTSQPFPWKYSDLKPHWQSAWIFNQVALADIHILLNNSSL